MTGLLLGHFVELSPSRTIPYFYTFGLWGAVVPKRSNTTQYI